jgi:hypothetical protein
MPAVTGSVSITGTPSVALAVGTSVNINGTPSVTVANPSSAPIPVAAASPVTTLLNGGEVQLVTPGTSQVLDVSHCGSLRIYSFASSSDYHLEVDAYASSTFRAGVLEQDLNANQTGSGEGVYQTPGSYVVLVATAPVSNVLVTATLYCRP